MKNSQKTLYLWDLADTIFSEHWNVKKSGVASFDKYLESLSYNLKTIDAKTYEWNYQKPFQDELMELGLLPGFVETLSWTKNNTAFTTGNPEQINWRAEKFMEKGMFDIRPFFIKIYSTFNFGNTNIKTPAMFSKIIEKEFKNGFNHFVYADNKIENCKMFLKGDYIKNLRCYHINNLSKTVTKLDDNFYECPDLPSLLKTEKALKYTYEEN